MISGEEQCGAVCAFHIDHSGNTSNMNEEGGHFTEGNQLKR